MNSRINNSFTARALAYDSPRSLAMKKRAVVNARVVILSALLLALVLSLKAQRTAESRSLTLPVGGDAGAVTSGDLNRDGKQDLVVKVGNSVSVYLGDGSGKFDRSKGSPFSAGENPTDLTLGDFDEDGRLDVAAANHETNYLSLLIGDGKGGLSPPSRIPVQSRPHPHGVAAGDFNGDRHIDLAVESWEEDTVLVLPGNGTAAFAGEPMRLSVGRRPYYKLRAADLDNDGAEDLVTTNADASSVSVLCTGRSRALQPAKNIAIARSPFAVAIGDVNGDRHLDLAIAHRWGGFDPNLDRLTVLIGSGNCVFTPTAESPLKVGMSPTAVAIGDVDGDGIGDIVTANLRSDDVSLFFGTRSGLRPAKESPLPAGKSPTAIVLADLNGDGKIGRAHV